MMVVVVLQVSAPYSRTVFTFILEILIMVDEQLFRVPYVLQL
ncbi:unnamed protein product [Schistosoma margrebowiei]|uniref:Uncharacterized protein n=1 Tax=Schistosoma margrebowiei TaxID=48269 RepID=A0A183MFY7_9TREM|nr:unnamed protein product [Schistosoma margrebowiei]